jgi:hypothetical protein
MNRIEVLFLCKEKINKEINYIKQLNEHTYFCTAEKTAYLVFTRNDSVRFEKFEANIDFATIQRITSRLTA